MNEITLIWKSKYWQLILFLFAVLIFGISDYIARPDVDSIQDLTVVDGTLRKIEKVQTRIFKILKSERDSTYHILLNEYPSRFQVSYSTFDKQTFYENTQIGDSIKLHIANRDTLNLFNAEQRIRSFSLYVNNGFYLSPNSGISGFGKGYIMIIISILSLISLVYIITKVIKDKRTATNKM